MTTQTTITELIPRGSENAIGRRYLASKCIEAGLIDRDAKDKDRELRKIIQEARRENVICNAGSGYFLPTKEDLPALRHDILRKTCMATEIFRSIKQSRCLLEDLEAGRIE